MVIYAKIKKSISKGIFTSCLQLNYPVSEEEILGSLEKPKREFGDIACPISFEISKKIGKPPHLIAEEIGKRLEMNKWIKEVKAAGGYINFFLKEEVFAKEVIFIKRGYGRGRKKEKKILIEFPSINPNKPWHVGHLRNAILGDSLARILEYAGYDVERIDFINDVGLQIAQSLWAYLHINNKIEGKIDHWLGKEYVNIAKRLEEEKVREEVNEIMKKLEEGNNEISEIGKELTKKCVLAQRETAYSLNIFHNILVWESDIIHSKLFKRGMELLQKKGAVYFETRGKNKGCVIAKLDEEEFAQLKSPDKILVRSDGTPTYTGKDVVFQLWKFGKINSRLRFRKFSVQPNGRVLYSTGEKGKKGNFGHADIVINVIGVEQKYTQNVIAHILKKIGYVKEFKNFVHLAYEHAELPTQKISGRKGTWFGYTADEVIKEAKARAYKEIKERFKDMSEEEKNRIAEMIGVGGVRFAFIRFTSEKRMFFEFDKALSFEGDSGPYIQYSYARGCRILEKAGKVKGRLDYSLIKNNEEKELLRELVIFPEVITISAEKYKPHILAEYLLNLATAFNKFYSTSPVLSAEERLKAVRLSIVRASVNVLKIGLELLGIHSPTRM